MSQYPYNYGLWPMPSTSQQHSYQPLHPSASAHGAHPDANPLEGQYAASQASFEYNANRIPGLGATSPPTASNQQVPGLLTGWDSASALPSAPPAANNGHQDTSFYSPQHPVQDHASSSAPAAIARPQSDDDDVEEGELSEGQFDDLYEPTEPASRPQPSSGPAAIELAEEVVDISESRDLSEVDLQDTTFYEEDEPGEITSDINDASTSHQAVADRGSAPGDRQKPRAAGRERSGSYSPYLSPREIHHEDASSEEPMMEDVVLEHELGVGPGEGQQPMNGSSVQITSQGQSHESLDQATAPFRSLDEAKKEAQKSILRLIPYGVKYQTYIEEGFDEKVIKSLFTDLGLNPPPIASNSNEDAQTERRSAEQTVAPLTHPVDRPASTNGGSAAAGSEERKDRIARLLALKASKPPAASPKAAAEPPSKTAWSSLDKTKTKKKQKQQKKMEALRKARDAKTAQAAAARPTATSGPAQAEIAPPMSQANAATSLQTTEEQQPSAATMPPRPPSQPLLASLRASSAQAGASTINVRKRPVASDFVDYPSAGGSLKRPFGQGRADSSLIIHVSDDSDDEDVEMEVDSPEESQTAAPRRTDSPTRRGLSFRDHPPLPDIPQRNYASSASSIRTPPNGFRNGTSREIDELERKEKQIQEMKRKIAEAEARKAKKVSTPAHTPNPTANDSPPPNDAPRPSTRRIVSMSDVDKNDGPSSQLLSGVASAKLPKPSERRNSAQEAKHERRARISSMLLPKLDVGLQEKMAKMRLWQDRVAKLQAEIEAEAAEKARLEAEMAELSTVPSPRSENGETSSSVLTDAQQPEKLTSESSSRHVSQGAADHNARRGTEDAVADTQVAALGETLVVSPGAHGQADGDGQSNPGGRRTGSRNAGRERDANQAEDSDLPVENSDDSEANSPPAGDSAAMDVTDSGDEAPQEDAIVATDADHVSLSPAAASGSVGGDDDGDEVAALPAQISDVGVPDATPDSPAGTGGEVPTVAAQGSVDTVTNTSQVAATAPAGPVEPKPSFTPYV